MRNPHILIIPLPAQGHVIPAMELALNLAKHDFKVTFVNTEFNHERVMKALPETDPARELIQMVSLTDGLKPSDDRNDLVKLWVSIFDVMPAELMALIERINGTESDKVSCLIADAAMAWALEVAEEMGIKRAAFWPASAALFALIFEIPSLVDGGILDSHGEYSLKHNDKSCQSFCISTSSRSPKRTVGVLLRDLFELLFMSWFEELNFSVLSLWRE